MLHAVIHPVPPHHAAHAGTAVTVALSCVRRAWLSERFAAAGGGPGAAATRGTLLHELLQRLMVEVVGMEAGAELPGVEQLEQMVSRVVRQSAFLNCKTFLFVGPGTYSMYLQTNSACASLDDQNMPMWRRMNLAGPMPVHAPGDTNAHIVDPISSIRFEVHNGF